MLHGTCHRRSVNLPSNSVPGAGPIAKFLKTVRVRPAFNRRLAAPLFLALVLISLHLLAFVPLLEVWAQEPGNVEGMPHKTVHPDQRGKSVTELLENLERVLDTAQYEEAQAEWMRIAPVVQNVHLRPQLVAQLTALYARMIRELLEAGAPRQAVEQWEQALASHPQINDRLTGDRALIWALPRAYVKINEHDKGIRLFREHFYESPMPGNYETPEDAAQRAQFGELLLFGKLGTTGKDEAVGRAQCALCHAFSKDSPMVEWESPPWGPHFFDFVPRIEGLIASPQYQQRPRNTIQPEAFPGSGTATSVIEYLAESMVCPNCFVMPGFVVKGTQDRESPMPAIHKPPISLTVEEMIAIDTWMLVQNGETVPPLSEMRAAYEKFLPPEDRPETARALFLASLYDAKGDHVEAIRLVELHYPRVWRRDPKNILLGHYLSEWRNDPTMFAHLKRRPNLVEKFPLLLQSQ